MIKLSKLVVLVSAFYASNIALLSSPLHEAARRGQVLKIKRLSKQKGFDANTRDKAGRTPLFYAKNARISRRLLERGAEPNIKDSDGNSPLHIAATLGPWVRSNMTRALIEYGGEVDAKNNNSDTPLHIAALFGHVGEVQTLINKGANVNARNKHGMTPLHVATSYMQAVLFSQLQKKHPKLGVLGDMPRIPVIGSAAALGIVGTVVGAPLVAAAGMVVAAGYGTVSITKTTKRRQIIKHLARADADMNVRDNGGNTVLHYVASSYEVNDIERKGTVGIASLLLRKGADPDVKNNAGKTPYDVAIASGSRKIAGLFAEHMKEKPDLVPEVPTPELY